MMRSTVSSYLLGVMVLIIKTSDGKYLDVYHDFIYPCQFVVYEDKDGKRVEKRVVRIFINQSCQEDPPPGLSRRSPPRDVVMKDSIYVAAQIPKFKAGKDPYFGSYYVLVLTYVFKTKAWNTHLVDLFLEVQELLPKVAKCADEVQFPPIMLGLRQPFYFFKNPHDFQFGVSHPVNLFTGRKAELMNLHAKFQQQNSLNLVAKKVAIVGLGGIGKSELARVYCQHFVGAVIWLNAETVETLTDSFRRVVTKHLQIPSEDDTSKIVTEVFICFIGKPCLFVFDNVEDVEIFEKYAKFPEPNSTPPFILITSQINRWSFRREEVLELFEMTEVDAVKLVKKALNSTEEMNDEILVELITTLQCLPMALSQASSYINRESRLQANAIGHYLELHRSSSKIPFVSGTKLGFHRHTKTIYTTFRLTMDKISGTKEYGNVAICLLQILSYFQPDKIPTKLLLSEDHKDALQLLLDFSVVNAESQNYSIRIHRLLQAFVRIELKENQIREEQALRDGLILLSKSANEDTAVHLFSVLKYCNNLTALIFFLDHALAVHFKDPNIMTSFLNSQNGRCITIEKCGNSDDDWNVTMDFNDLIKIGSDPGQVQETYILSHLLETNKTFRAKFTSLPLVQLFIEWKWKKMEWATRISMVFQIIWTVTIFFVIRNIFMIKYGNRTDDDWEKLENKSWNLFHENESQQDFSDIVIYSSIFLLVFTTILTVKEILDLITTPKLKIYIIPKENWGQWLLIISIYVLLGNVIFPKFLPVHLDCSLSMVVLLTSCILLLGQSKKHHKSVVYKEVYTQTLKKVGWLFLWFSCFLVLFNWGVILMIPFLEKFNLWPPFGSDEFAAMLTGEYRVDVIDDREADATELFQIFPVVTIAVLVIALDILIVDWTKNLEHNARLSSLVTQLQQLHLMEAFITKIFGWFPVLVRACKISGNKSEQIKENNPYVVKKPLKEFSRESKVVLLKLQADRDAMQAN